MVGTLNRSIRKKLFLLAVIVLSAFFLFEALESWHSLEKVEGYGEKSRRGRAFQTATMHALSAVLTANGKVDQLVEASTLEELAQINREGESFRASALRFDMWINALKLGTESVEFQQANGGLTIREWERTHSADKIKIEHPSSNIKRIASEADLLFADYWTHAQDAASLANNAVRQYESNKLAAADATRKLALQSLEMGAPYLTKLRNKLYELVNEVNKQTEIDWTKTAASEKRAVIVLALIKFSILLSLGIGGQFVLDMLFAKPLSKLNHDVENLNTTSPSLTVNRNDEFGTLANSINTMLSNLKDTTYSKDFLDQILESTPEPLLLLDEEENIFFANLQAERCFGYSSEELKTLSIGDIFIDYVNLDKTRHLQAVNNFRSSSTPSSREISGKRKNGTILPLDISQSIIQTSARKVFAVGAKDLTEAKRIEKALREKDALKDALKAQERLLGVLAHELRTPLAAMRITTEFLSETYTGDEMTKTSIDSIHLSSVRMAEIVNDLLEVARLNSGSAKWKWGSYDLKEICDQAIQIVQPLVSSKTVKIACLNQTSSKPFLGDKMAIKRLLTNFISNSIRYTDDGEINISFEHSQDWVRISVSDSGCGIEPEKLEHLGKAFKLNSGVIGNDQIGGSGLGLAICKAIAEAHGGELEFTSTLGEGTVASAIVRTNLEQPIEPSEKEPNISGEERVSA